MFIALNNEGAAASSFYELFVGNRKMKMKSDERMRAMTGCAVLASTLRMQRVLTEAVVRFLGG